jgi:hypothetical protein
MEAILRPAVYSVGPPYEMALLLPFRPNKVFRVTRRP